MSKRTAAKSAHDAQPPERVMPHSLEAERSVLGAVLLANDRFLDVADELRDEDFYRDAHRRVFSAMRELVGRKRAIDPLTLAERLHARGDLHDVGAAYIHGLVDGVPHGTNVEHYAAIVREHAMRRRLILLANQMVSDARDGSLDLSAILDKAEAGIIDVSNRQLAGETLTSFAALMDSIENQIADIAAGVPLARGIATRWAELDEMTGGLKPGLIVVGARSQMGKTTMMMNLAERLAAQGKEPGIIFSLEMDKEELGIRAVAAQARFDAHRLTTSNGLTNYEVRRLGSAIDELATRPLYIDDSAYRTVGDIRTISRRVKAKEGLAFIAVDYLQLIEAAEGARDERREQQVAAASRGLKAISKELRTPVVALAQILRTADDRQGGRPQIRDLRESGAIENDADLVLLLYRPYIYDKTKPRDQAELIIAKQRNGPVGSLFLRYDAASYRFDDWQEDARAGAVLPFASEA